MGEFAINRKGERVKIGTCENMYYIRHDQINEVEYNFNFNCYFRLPLESEKKYGAGEFPDFGDGNGILIYNADDFFTHEQVDTLKPGVQYIKNGFGIMINLPCYHGLKLPQITGAEIYWNGKTPCFDLKFLFYRHNEKKLEFAIFCKTCGTTFLCDVEEAKKFAVLNKNRADLDNMIKYVEEFNTQKN